MNVCQQQLLFSKISLTCPLTDEWMKLWYICAMKYYLAIKRNLPDSDLVRWMNLEPVIQSEVSQKNKYHLLRHICGVQKNGTGEPIHRAGIEREKGLVDTGGEGEGGANRESSTDVYSLACVKQLVESCCIAHKLSLRVSCDNLEGRDGMRGRVRGRLKRKRIYVYLWLIPVDVQQKPAQHCKAVILQLNFF